MSWNLVVVVAIDPFLPLDSCYYIRVVPQYPLSLQLCNCETTTTWKSKQNQSERRKKIFLEIIWHEKNESDQKIRSQWEKNIEYLHVEDFGRHWWSCRSSSSFPTNEDREKKRRHFSNLFFFLIILFCACKNTNKKVLASADGNEFRAVVVVVVVVPRTLYERGWMYKKRKRTGMVVFRDWLLSKINKTRKIRLLF